MVIERVGDVLVVAQTPIEPSDAEWDQEVVLVRSGLLKRILVVTAGGAPNAAQRKRYTEATGTQRILVGVVTESRIAVAVLTCLSWFVGKGELKAFSPAEFRDALTHLGLSDRESEMRKIVQQLQARLGDKQAAEASSARPAR
ncbi:MAG TPA: hypothetical protein VHB21_20590 [Minicystis sp.]|nr:hypothetical protein [Minicystis sp.]